MTTVTLSKFRAGLPGFVKAVDEGFEQITITVNGVPRATVVSPEELESYDETISVLSNERAVKALVRAEKDWQKGEVFSHDDVFGA